MLYLSYLCSYFINHYTKTTSWEDPRVRYQQIGKATSKENKKEVDSSTSSAVAPPGHSDEQPPAASGAPLKVALSILCWVFHDHI